MGGRGRRGKEQTVSTSLFNKIEHINAKNMVVIGRHGSYNSNLGFYRLSHDVVASNVDQNRTRFEAVCLNYSERATICWLLIPGGS